MSTTTCYDCCCWCCCMRCCSWSGCCSAWDKSKDLKQPFEHKYVELKGNNKRMHIVFCKGQKRDTTVTTNTIAAVGVVTKQPKKRSSVVAAADNAAFASEEANKQQHVSTDISVHIDPPSQQQQQHNVININGLYYQDSKKSLGYMVIYRNKIEPALFTRTNVLFQQSMSSDTLATTAIATATTDNDLPLLFFIHGVGGCARIWQQQMSHFAAQGYDVCAIDLLGHGASTVPDDVDSYQFLRMAERVLFVFDMYAKKSNVIVGHSYGCSFATYLAQMKREAVTKLVMISGGSPHPLDYKSCLLDVPTWMIRFIRPCMDFHFFCNGFSSKCCDLPANYRDAFRISSRSLQYTMKGQVWTAADEQYHKRIKVPMLLIEGEYDNFVPLDDAKEMLHVVQYSYLIVLNKASHMLIMEQSDKINEIIHNFINNKHPYDDNNIPKIAE